MSAIAQTFRRNPEAAEALDKYIEERLNKYRLQLESGDTALDKVPALRARIQELKSLHQSIHEEAQ